MTATITDPAHDEPQPTEPAEAEGCPSRRPGRDEGAPIVKDFTKAVGTVPVTTPPPTCSRTTRYMPDSTNDADLHSGRTPLS